MGEQLAPTRSNAAPVLRSLPGWAADRYAAVGVIPPRPWLRGKRGKTTPAAYPAGERTYG
jgi:hypothetical protein